MPEKGVQKKVFEGILSGKKSFGVIAAPESGLGLDKKYT